MKGILGKKLGMTQVFTPEGNVIAVSVIEAGPCVVLQKKDLNIDGYEAVQLGFSDKKESRSNKPEQGHAKKANATPKRYVREIRGVDLGALEVGQELKADVFTEGEFVDVTGTSKGKGFQGVIKRWGQSRGPMAHGSRYHRRPGSMGSIQANRVPKGKRLPGHMGHTTVTVQRLEIIKVDVERNVLLVKGAIPGPKNSFLKIKESVKK
ncbi:MULTISPECIES: 50S ribosomal protein L3 [unclassified Paenibacillus]|uniref:50S ribosomal protein L3 n=1 Tax=unclassified Paenibacillus TaxID=185978 RepID=UPI0024066508|nr:MULTISPECIES: 50S ribosomal protein L3 [unclassified Paenibacillus]MDF9844441.1 large subunit ribosomal protein L3 [Paenibacillus sp. PastF-2]MDF9851045.1 large subunit ribosomal protein L3 [Paenibacillus sp. PastM-2]MDF9857626.1 large subunit ribosomal protein L3 [Paenibacillus sp. PastF-1]MDH6482883.1 large subunit ribosomal protein L3 [Paenibacillus sp. PastH-2]MDH6510308.1 large subunit ribosomal protein L3 [Paenibacillus sp. PastM-3]